MFPDPVETVNCTCPLTLSVRSNVASEASAVLAASPNAADASNSFFIKCLVSQECVPRNQGNADQLQKLTIENSDVGLPAFVNQARPAIALPSIRMTLKLGSRLQKDGVGVPNP